jgi:salicylate hydroxylase
MGQRVGVSEGMAFGAPPLSQPERGSTIVVGAGIGGLTAALSLARAGRDVLVLEQAKQLGEVGAGIQLSPNATRVLYSLGLREQLEAVAFVPEAIEARASSGRLVMRQPLGAHAISRYGFPYLHLHRADLHAALAAAAAADPHVEIRLSARIAAVSTDSRSAHAVLAGSEERVDAELLVGADGIHSVVRESLLGRAKPRFTGNVAWRALIPVDELSGDRPAPVAGVWMGAGAHVVLYYLRGGELVNVVAVVEQDGWEVESWSERGDPDELRAVFAGWHPSVTSTLAAVQPDTCYRWALLDREPLPSWSGERVVLLGDACHPTLPFLAQGAAMAIEDGACLALCLATGASPADALRRYEALRKPRTSKVQRVSRLNARLFHVRGRSAAVRNRLLPIVTRRTGFADQLYAHDALSYSQTGGSNGH